MSKIPRKLSKRELITPADISLHLLRKFGTKEMIDPKQFVGLNPFQLRALLNSLNDATTQRNGQSDA